MGDISIRFSTDNVTDMTAIRNMVDELIGNTHTQVAAGFEAAGTTETPVADPQAAFQQPVAPTVSVNVTVPPGVTAEQIAAVPPAPAPVAPAAVPPAPVAAPAAVPQSAEKDSAGLPWDGRIHAKNKAKCQDGTWKKGKDIDPNLIAAVEAELRAAVSAPVIPPAAAPTPVAAPVATPAGAIQQVPAAPGAPVDGYPTPLPTAALPNLDGANDGFPPPPTGTIPAAIPAVPAAPVAPAPPTTFADLMAVVTTMQTTGKISFPEIVAVCNQHGLANLALIAANPALIPQVYASLEAIWAGR